MKNMVRKNYKKSKKQIKKKEENELLLRSRLIATPRKYNFNNKFLEDENDKIIHKIDIVRQSDYWCFTKEHIFCVYCDEELKIPKNLISNELDEFMNIDIRLEIPHYCTGYHNVIKK